MISTSFLRTLNLKKYQDFAEQNKNRLKVFYTRTASRLNKKSNKENTLLKKIKTPRCLCLSEAKDVLSSPIKKAIKNSKNKQEIHIKTNNLCFVPPQVNYHSPTLKFRIKNEVNLFFGKNLRMGRDKSMRNNH